MRVIGLIASGEAEEALRLLSGFYGVKVPGVRIGLPRGCYRAYACFVPGKWTIFFRDAEVYRDPFTVLHEFYHAMRYRLGKHRGTERHADHFAADLLRRAALCLSTS